MYLLLGIIRIRYVRYNQTVRAAIIKNRIIIIRSISSASWIMLRNMIWALLIFQSNKFKHFSGW